MDRNITQYSINDFINWYEDGTLVLVPYFQRRNVWARKAKSFLIDTVLRNLPIPVIIIRESINPKTGRTLREVVDGQQRLRSVFEFYKNELIILRTHNEELGGLTFQDLAPPFQLAFRTYILPVNVLYGASDSDVLDIFARLNSYTLVLNSQEKLNAKYHGEFKTFIYRESYKYLDFFRSNRILSNARIIRMGEAEFFSELIIVMIDGLQHQKKIIGRYYRKFDDEFPLSHNLRERFSVIIQKIEDVLGETLKSTIYRKSNLFYNLFSAFYDLIYGMEGGNGSQSVDIQEQFHQPIVDQLLYVSDQAEAEIPDLEYVEFKLACTGHLDNLKERTIRHNLIKNAIMQGLEQ